MIRELTIEKLTSCTLRCSKEITIFFVRVSFYFIRLSSAKLNFESDQPGIQIGIIRVLSWRVNARLRGKTARAGCSETRKTFREAVFN